MGIKIQYPLSGNPPECICIDQVDIEGVNYEVFASFDKILRLFDLLEDDNVDEEIKADVAANIIVKSNISTMNISEKIELIRNVIGIYSSANDTEPDVDIQGNPLPKKGGQETYRINCDGDLIYSAFMQTYKIDLFEEQGKLHFKKFSALLKGLPEDTQFSKICGIRGYKKPTKSDTYEKHMMRMKELFKLPEKD